MSGKASTRSVTEIVQALRSDTGEIDLSPQASRLVLRTLEHLAGGQPVSNEKVTALASELNLSLEEANETLDWIAERNPKGEIVGLAGLSLSDWKHKFALNGHTLSTWCALDTLYLPTLLNQSARVSSPDPVTEQPVEVTVSPQGVVQAEPQSALLSIVVPRVADKGLQSAEEIWTAFCNYSHYFSSRQTAEAWFAERHVEPIFLSLEDGFELALEWFAKLRRYVE